MNTLKKIEKYLNTVNEMRDEVNPIHAFRMMDTELVLAFATGKLKAQEYAKFEMANRGYGKKGEWVGFDNAKKIWKPKVK